MICFLISSCVVLMIPLAEKYTGTVMDILPGILFWAGILLGIFFYIISYSLIRDTKGFHMVCSADRIGALAPGSTPEGLAADILFVPACVVTILGTFFIVIPGWVMIISMWITLLSFYGHFVFNGRVYKFLHKRKVIRYRKVKEESAERDTQLKEGV